jgi:hypothetical protein
MFFDFRSFRNVNKLDLDMIANTILFLSSKFTSSCATLSVYTMNVLLVSVIVIYLYLI